MRSKFTPPRAKAPVDQVFENASDFNKDVIQLLEPTSMARILIEHFTYYFFSYTQNIQLEVLDIAEIVSHFEDFFSYALTNFQGSEISRAYAQYYVR